MVQEEPAPPAFSVEKFEGKMKGAWNFGCCCSVIDQIFQWLALWPLSRYCGLELLLVVEAIVESLHHRLRKTCFYVNGL